MLIASLIKLASSRCVWLLEALCDCMLIASLISFEQVRVAA